MMLTCEHGKVYADGRVWGPHAGLPPPNACLVCHAKLVLKPQRARACAVRPKAAARHLARPRTGLGDAVAWVLKRFGITPARWSRVMGGKCNCRSRQSRLNRWGWKWWDRAKKLVGRR